LITEDIRNTSTPERFEIEDASPEVYDKDALFPEPIIRHLSKTSYIWNFSLIYKAGFFDVIKWKTAFAFRWKEDKLTEDIEIVMDKGLFIGAVGGIFFISIDDEIHENFNNLADMMDIFLEKTHKEAPFVVYGCFKDKEQISRFKSDKEMMKHLADVKKWISSHKGEFRLENLTELKANLDYFISEYSHFILTRLTGKTKYPNLGLGEVHYLDYADLIALKEIESALAEQVKAGETVDELLAKLFFEILKRKEFQEEKIEKPKEDITQEEVIELKPSKIKQILEEIRLGIRRMCPSCFNNDRKKIKEIVDREHLIMENPNIYGFKFVCGMCGHEWKTKSS